MRQRAAIVGVLREAVASTLAQPVASIVSVAIVAGMCAAVLLTTGRTVGAEQSVIATIDQEGTRSILVRADADAGLDASVERLASLEGVEWAGAFGFAQDVFNSKVGPGGAPVAIRTLWSTDPAALGLPMDIASSLGRTAWGSSAALAELGMQGSTGGVTTRDGVDYAVMGTIELPQYLGDLEPMLLSRSTDYRGPVATLVVVASRPELVAPISRALATMLSADDPTKLTVSTSEALATLRELVQGKLGSFGRELVLLIFGLSALLVAAILYGLVSMRRRDYGRRRALGATRSLIVALVLMQTALVSSVGAVAGTFLAVAVLLMGGDPLPSLAFFVALDLLAVAVAVLAAIWPAISASRRDPARELRVP